MFQYHRKDWPKSEPCSSGWGTDIRLLDISLPSPFEQIDSLLHGRSPLTSNSNRKFNGDESFVAFPDEPAAATESPKL